MRLEELSRLLVGARVNGDPAAEVKGVAVDSRSVRPGDLFICIPGVRQDGHDYADHAKRQGAAALVVERPLDTGLPEIVVKDARHAMAAIACHVYGYPSHEMKVIGVTGTNGKSTVTHLLDHIFAEQGAVTGLMGTLGIKFGGRQYPTLNTTVDALEMQRWLRLMRDAGTEYCFMEVSSHALAMGRVKGVNFRTAVFTNLTQDHLDFHGTMEAYKAAKGLLFSRLGNTFSATPDGRKYAVLNADDEVSREFANCTAAHTVTYGFSREADVRADRIRYSPQGTRFRIESFAGEAEFHIPLVGKFNVYNALAATAAALCEGLALSDIAGRLATAKGAEGRFQTVSAGQPFLVIVDYAHTPDSLENVLSTISEFAEGRIYCVFGCGGDRDRTKRPVMGRIAARYSDCVILTSDNPRTEDPRAILEEVERGIREEGMPSSDYYIIEDRGLAIEKAVDLASPGDVVLIAGKGHETYQEINGVRIPFDDRVVAEQAIRRRMQ